MSLQGKAQRVCERLLSPFIKEPDQAEIAHDTDDTDDIAVIQLDEPPHEHHDEGTGDLTDRDEAHEEFSSFLNDLGAEPVEPDLESAILLKDLTITNLTDRLMDLRGLGDELAEAEKRRLAGSARILELEAELEGPVSELDTVKAENERLRAALAAMEAKLQKSQDANQRTHERLAKSRKKFEDRNKVAADRWREIQKLKREHREEIARLEGELPEGE